MSKVELYIYDLSGGLAAGLSQQFLGKRLDGIWHTSIVVFGREYFFGGDGISFVTPGGTVLGPPLEIQNLGETHITIDILESALYEWAQSRYMPAKYDLFEHNCNTFSNDLAQFLVNKGIPPHILSLPKEVLSTPMGGMLRQFFDTSRDGVHARSGVAEGHIRATGQPSRTASGSASPSRPGTGQPNRTASASSSRPGTGAKAPRKKGAKDKNNSSSSLSIKPVLYQEPLDEHVSEFLRGPPTSWHEEITNLQSFLSKADNSSDDLSVGCLTLLELAFSPEVTLGEQAVVMELMRLLVWKCADLVITEWQTDESKPLERLLQRWETTQRSSNRILAEATTKFWANCVFMSLKWSLDEDMELPLEGVAQFALHMLEDVDTRVYGLGLALNLALHSSLSEDTATQLGTFLLHLAQETKTTFPPTAFENLVGALCVLMEEYPFLVELARIQQLQLLETDDPVCARIQQLLQSE